MYPNVFHAARSITDAAGVRGLFTGYLPNLLEDVPDMAFKFAAYESMRSLHRRLNNGRSANVQVELASLRNCQCSGTGLLVTPVLGQPMMGTLGSGILSDD